MKTLGNIIATAIVAVAVVYLIGVNHDARERSQDLVDSLKRVQLWTDCRPPKIGERLIINHDGRRFACEYHGYTKDQRGSSIEYSPPLKDLKRM